MATTTAPSDDHFAADGPAGSGRDDLEVAARAVAAAVAAGWSPASSPGPSAGGS